MKVETQKQEEQCSRHERAKGIQRRSKRDYAVRAICFTVLMSFLLIFATSAWLGLSVTTINFEMGNTSTKAMATEEETSLSSTTTFALAESSIERGILIRAHGQRSKAPLKKNETYLILHIGPGKMATEYLQEVASQLDRRIFSLDNYIYDGHSPHGKYPLTHGTPLTALFRNFSCYPRAHGMASPSVGSASTILPCWKELQTVLQGYQGKNVFVSTILTQLPQEWWGPFSRLASTLGFRIVIIFGYRRLYEWLPSTHAQGNRLTKPQFHKWPQQDGNSSKKYRAVGPPIREYIMGHQYTTTTPLHSIRGKWTSTLLSRIPNELETWLFNLHAKTNHSMASNFFCNMIPEAKHACNECLRGERSTLGSSKSNTAIDTSFDVISVAAAKAGFINTRKYERIQVRDAAQAFSSNSPNKSAVELPLICLSDGELELFLNATLQWEAFLLPNMQDEEDHRAGFWSAVAKKKLCDVDATRALQMPAWKSFFERFAE